MKKPLFFIVICVCALAVLALSVGAASDIRVLLDGEQIEFDVPPQIVRDRTMVPIRAIFEALGAKVEWDASTRTATATIDDYTVECTIDQKWMTVREDTVKMDVAPVIIGGRTLVPARFAAEAFGGVVGWDGNTRTVHITSAAALPVPEVNAVLCAKHSFDARGYCTACGFASDYQAIDVEDTAYIVTENGAEMRLRGYAVEKVIGKLQKGDRITVTLQVSNPFGGVWYVAEKDGQKFLVYSGDVRTANVLSLSAEKETDVSETSFTIHATCTYTQKLPDYVAIYVGTGNTLDLIAETSEINGKNGSFSITCNVGRIMSLAPSTTYFYQIQARSDGVIYKSAARAVTTAEPPMQTTQPVIPVVPEEPKEEKFLGYQEGNGSAKTAWGKTVIVSVFVDDKESSWDNETASMQLALTKLNRAMSWFAEQCRSYKADTEIVCDWGTHADLFYRMDFNNAPYSAEQAALLDGIDTEELLKRYNADNIIYMLFYNKVGRSEAAAITSKVSRREYDTVNLCFKGQYVDADMYPDGEWVSTYAHEVAHCFGAYDLYREADGIPDAYKDYLYDQALNNNHEDLYDIMLIARIDPLFENSSILSELDAYYIGLIPYCADVDTWGLPKVGIE